MHIVLLGAPGAGKGTQARLISAKYGAEHISMGHILREEIANKTPAARKIQPSMRKGEMVPDEIIRPLLEKRLLTLPSFILDGYPRTLQQAKTLDEIMDMAGQSLDAVFLLEVPLDVVIDRLAGRRVCSECGKTYHIKFYHGDRCTCGGKLIRRDDDNPETIKNRMRIYNEQIGPVKEFYKKKGLLHIINADATAERTYSQICEILDEEVLARP